MWAGAEKSVWKRKARPDNEKEQQEQPQDKGARRQIRSREIVVEVEVQAEIETEGARRRSRSQMAAVQEQEEVDIETRPTSKPFKCPVCDDKFELRSSEEEVHMKIANKNKSSEKKIRQ